MNFLYEITEGLVDFMGFLWGAAKVAAVLALIVCTLMWLGWVGIIALGVAFLVIERILD